MSLAKEKLIALMQFADGELDGDENEAARAAVITSLETDPEARAFLDEMERLGDVTRAVEPLAIADTSTFDVADAVMGLVEEHENKNAVTTRLGGKSKQVTAAVGAPVSSLEVAREKRRRVGVVIVTGLALAAGIALVMRSQPHGPSDEMKSASLSKPVDSVPALTASGVPALPATSEAALAAAAASNPGVEVNVSDSPQTSVFYLPGSDGTPASAVVWVDESSGGNK